MEEWMRHNGVELPAPVSKIVEYDEETNKAVKRAQKITLAITIVAAIAIALMIYFIPIILE